MIEKVTLEMNARAGFDLAGGISGNDLNPKALLLYAGAKCAGLTALRIMQAERVTPVRLEITLSGELDTETLRAESLFLRFHIAYNVACADNSQQVKVSHAVRLAHEKYCGTLRMLERIAPMSHEIDIVTTGTPAHV